MAIYFHKNLTEKALKALEESHELSDLSRDLQKVQWQMEQVAFSNLCLVCDNFERFRRLQQAKELNDALRKKYPVINNLLNIANRLPKVQSSSPAFVGASETDEYECLRQDYYGILCHTLLKKKLIEAIEEFIEQVK